MPDAEAASSVIHSTAETGVLDEASDAQLRQVVERSWGRLASIVDGMIGKGQLLSRDVLIDMARFLENAMAAVQAYERLVAGVADDQRRAEDTGGASVGPDGHAAPVRPILAHKRGRTR